MSCVKRDERFVALDFETADNGGDSACAMGIVRVENGEVVLREHYLIRPPRKQMFFTHIHGIRWSDVANQPTFGELWSRVRDRFDGVDFISAHNASFDRRVLYASCETYGLVPPPQPFLCTVDLARKIWNIRPTKLPNVCQFLNIELNHHDALSDASACAQIVIAAFGEKLKAPTQSNSSVDWNSA